MEAVVPVSVATILGAPILSNYGVRYGFIENILVRIVLVAAILYVIQQDTFAGLITFLAVFTLLLERNHALAIDLPNQRPDKLGNRNSVPMTTKAEPVRNTVVNLQEEEPHGELSDNIPRLEQAPSASEAVAFFNKL